MIEKTGLYENRKVKRVSSQGCPTGIFMIRTHNLSKTLSNRQSARSTF